LYFFLFINTSAPLGYDLIYATDVFSNFLFVKEYLYPNDKKIKKAEAIIKIITEI